MAVVVRGLSLLAVGGGRAVSGGGGRELFSGGGARGGGVSCCGAWALGARLWHLWQAGSVAACGILVPQQGIEPTSCALQGRFLTTGSPGQFPFFLLKVFKRKHHLKINFATFLLCHMY